MKPLALLAAVAALAALAPLSPAHASRAAVVGAFDPVAADPADPAFLEDWMGALYPLIANQTLLDISLPGTHDSMTTDLSTTVADGSNDIEPVLAWILHEFHDFTPGNFIRNQSRTQGLNITEQLDAGIRFIDFRIMYSAGPENASTSAHDWYCLHFMETNHKAMYYLSAARAWMDEHPKEIVVFWLSRHGSECLNGSAQYPDVDSRTKQAFWATIEAEFGDLLFDSSLGLLNETTIAEMVSRNQRVVMYTADYSAFTGGSSRAIDSCFIDNELGDDIDNEVSSLQDLINGLATANVTRAKDKAKNMFYLQTMAGGAPGAQIELAAAIHFIPFDHEKNAAKCAALFHIPNMTDWCPMTLMDVSLLTNYYNQIALEKVILDGLHFPNAIYLDGVDHNGLIRTGTQLLNDESSSSSSTSPDADHGVTGFAYADTIILYNINSACSALPPSQTPPLCSTLSAFVAQRRALHPFAVWDDSAHGRLTAWPQTP